MARTVQKAATIVAVVAQVAAFVSLALGNPALAGIFQTIAMAAGAVAAVSSFFVKPPSLGGGSQTSWKAEPSAPIPYIVGRTASGGWIVQQDAYGDNRKYQFFVTVRSLGPVQDGDGLLVDNGATTFSSGNAVGYYHDLLWQGAQLGATPEASALAPFHTGPWPGWDASSKLSGLAADLLEMKYDVKGDHNFRNGVPKTLRVTEGVKVYDPRLDDTYPGGSGDCRALDETTYVYSENPWLHLLTYAIGRFQNGRRVFGIGMAMAAIVTPAVVEAANVADANEWTCGGEILSTHNKWEVMKSLAQAGGGVPIRMAAQLSCLVSAPRVSLATIEADDLAGEVSVAGTRPRRDRVNGVVPRYRSEDHDWEMVDGAVVRNSAYVTIDGGERTKSLEFPLVQDVDQAAQLARYEIENAREIGPITLTLKPKWIGYKPGDCVTVNVPEANLVSQPCLIIARTIDPTDGTVTFQLIGETTAKHTDALGQTTTAPPIPDTTAPDMSVVAAPGGGAWTVAATSITSGGVTLPALVITGAVDNDAASEVIFEYKINGSATWNPAGIEPPTVTRKEILGINPSTAYDVGIRYRVLGVLSARLTLTTAPGTVAPPPYVTTLGAGLTALEAFNTNGLIVQTANDTYAGRTLTAPAAGFTITNPAGTAGNPTFVLANDLASLEAAAATGAMYYRSATDTWATVTIGGSLSFSSGTLGLNLGNSNTFTAEQIVSARFRANCVVAIGTRTNIAGVPGVYMAYNTLGDSKGEIVAVHGGVADIDLRLEAENLIFCTAGNNTRMTIDSTGHMNQASGLVHKINSLQVVGPRKTGWATATGTATRTTFATGSVTLPQLAERVKALIDDLHNTAGHGLIGT